jgi:hypothetical protein
MSLRRIRLAVCMAVACGFLFAPGIVLPAAAEGGSGAKSGTDAAGVKPKVERRYALEKEIDVDESIQTWLYVFSAVMLLCIGWLCFKPTRLEKMKAKGRGGLSRKVIDAAKKGAKGAPK